MQQNNQPNRPFWGLRISIALHAMLLCMLAAVNNVHQSEVKPLQFVEVATIAGTPEHQGQLSAPPTQSQAQPLSSPKPVPAPIPTKPLKPQKPKVKIKPRVPLETSTALSNMPEPDSNPIAPPNQGNAENSPIPTGSDKNSTGGGAGGEGTGRGGASNPQNLVVLYRVTPSYPPGAKARGIQGWVQVEFTVTPAGTVSNARIVDANPKQIFDQAALDAIQRWRFKPALKDGQPVEQKATLKLVFRLEAER